MYSENDEEHGEVVQISSSKKIRPQRHSGRIFLLQHLNAGDSQEFDLIARINDLPDLPTSDLPALPEPITLPETLSDLQEVPKATTDQTQMMVQSQMMSAQPSLLSQKLHEVQEPEPLLEPPLPGLSFDSVR